MTAEAMVDWDTADAEAEFTTGPLPRGTSRVNQDGSARQTRTRRVSEKRLDSLKAKLSAEMFQAGTMIGLGVPVTGYYICQESDTFTTAVVQLASRKTEWIVALENLAMIGPGIAAGRTVLGIGAALAADRYYRTQGTSGLSPERHVAMFLGVTTAYMAVHPPEGGGSNAAANGYNPPPSTSFIPVS